MLTKVLSTERTWYTRYCLYDTDTTLWYYTMTYKIPLTKLLMAHI